MNQCHEAVFMNQLVMENKLIINILNDLLQPYCISLLVLRAMFCSAPLTCDLYVGRDPTIGCTLNFVDHTTYSILRVPMVAHIRRSCRKNDVTDVTSSFQVDVDKYLASLLSCTYNIFFE